MTVFWTAYSLLVVLLAAVLCGGLIVLLRPILRRYALAAPSSRSSHRIPTPQGGGIAVVLVTLAVSAAALVLFPQPMSPPLSQLGPVFAGTVLLAGVGALDDIVQLSAGPRLVVQVLAVALTLLALPAELRIVSALPWWLERLLLLLAGLWFVNLFNFMDGIDWMTVSEVVPVTLGLAVVGLCGGLRPDALTIALALLGAMLGFAPFNRPVAQVFLGDVGSLPIGLLVGWLLLLLAGSGHLLPAVLLPLYYLCDATITLGRRVVRGERVWQAHRLHYYQQAIDRGFSVRAVVGRVFMINIALAALASLAATITSPVVELASGVVGTVLVGCLLVRLSWPPKLSDSGT